jgi:DNA invertase Pin-like site-specific DNA recombinase
VVCWRLDRLGRNLKHLVTLLEELQALGVAFVSLCRLRLLERIAPVEPRGAISAHTEL